MSLPICFSCHFKILCPSDCVCSREMGAEIKNAYINAYISLKIPRTWAWATLKSSKFWNPGVSRGGLKILPVWVRPPLGALSVRKLSHFGVRNSSTWINNAYTNAYTLPEDFKAMSCGSVPSQPTHLHSSKALAPTAPAIGLSDQVDPPLLNLWLNRSVLGS